MKQLTIPFFLSHLPIDERGYAIPFFVAYVNGKPDFRMLDEKKQMACINNQLCSICGKKLIKKTMFFISGPIGVANQVATDPPMHRECAEYSLITCPHLYIQKAQRNDRGDVFKEFAAKNPMLQAEKDGRLPMKPDAIYLVRSQGYKIQISPGGIGKLLKFRFDLVEEYEYQDGFLTKTGKQSKEMK